MSKEPQRLDLEVDHADLGDAADGYYPVTLATNRGDVECQYYESPASRFAALFVGGVGGGFDTPAAGLYPRLADDLAAEGISALRVKFRHPTIMEEAVLDVLAGIAFLESDGVDTIGLVGHSFGGAAVIQAAAISPLVRTVVALATQGYGAEPAADLPADTSLLLIHGRRDSVLRPASSEYVHKIAHEPKRLVLIEDADHGLDEAAEEVYGLVREWLVTELKKPDV